MIEELHLRNFKSARDLRLQIAPLTILSGLNGSGKSTVLQSLALLQQTHEQVDAASLLLNGSLVSLGYGRDVLTDQATDDYIDFAVTKNGQKIRWQFEVIPDADMLPMKVVEGSGSNCFPCRDFQFLQADRLVPATLYPRSSYQARTSGFLGTRGEFTPDFIANNRTKKVSEGRSFPRDALGVPAELYSRIASTPTLPRQVAGWLQHLSPGVRFDAGEIKHTDQILLQFEYVMTGSDESGTGQKRRPKHVGFGLTYSLPIIVACLAAPSGAVLLLENPEAHLHPQGQAALGLLLGMCAADGVQLVVETHSDHLLNGVRVAVRSKKLNADDVQVHHFTRNLETGSTSAESPVLLSDGQMSNWPLGFFDQIDRSLDKLLS